MKRPALVVAAAAVVLIVAAATWAVWPRGTTEVTEQDALEDYREQSEDAADTDSSTDTAAPPVPDPGVYTFDAAGEEQVKLGPLPTETRPLPETVTATVIDDGDGCFELTIKLFEEHTEDTRYCTDGGTLTLDAHTKHQQIGGLSPTAEMACEPAILASTDQTDHDLSCTLDLSGGPAAVSATLAGTSTRGAPEELAVGADPVEATPVTTSYDVTGDLTGTWTETAWLAENNLPVRVERTLDLSGPATFTETSQLDLVSLTPAT